MPMLTLRGDTPITLWVSLNLFTPHRVFWRAGG